MPAIVHGTTFKRAERIFRLGPDPRFKETPGSYVAAEQFCAYLATGPYVLYSPQEYACQKAALFPNEGGAAIIEIEVPIEIIEMALDPIWLPLEHGLLQFDPGAGLDELRAGWDSFFKKIVTVDCP